jgi:hypothetical protein
MGPAQWGTNLPPVWIVRPYDGEAATSPYVVSEFDGTYSRETIDALSHVATVAPPGGRPYGRERGCASERSSPHLVCGYLVPG